MSEEQVEKQTEKKQLKFKKSKIILFALLIVLIGVGIFAAFSLRNSRQSGTTEYDEYGYSPLEQTNKLFVSRTVKVVPEAGFDLGTLKSNYKAPPAIKVNTIKTPVKMGDAEITFAYPQGLLYNDEISFTFNKDIFAAGGEIDNNSLISVPELKGTERKLNSDTVKYFVEAEMQYGKVYQGKLTYEGKNLDFSFFKPMAVYANYNNAEGQYYFSVTPEQASLISQNGRDEAIKKILEEQLYIEAEKDKKIVQSGIVVEWYSYGTYYIKPTLNLPKNIKLNLKSFADGIIKTYGGEPINVPNGHDNKIFALNGVYSDQRILSAITFDFSKRVSPQEFAKHLKITPMPQGLNLENFYRDHYYYGSTRMELPTDLFLQDVTYNFVLSAALQNAVDKKTLNEEIEFEICFKEAKPILDMESGFNIIETKFPYYSFSLRNISTVNVSIYEAQPDKLFAAMQNSNDTENIVKYGRLKNSYSVTANLDSYVYWQKLDLQGNGIYLVNVAPSEKLENIHPKNTIINVTNIGLMAKKSLKNLAIWTTDLNLGTVAASVDITVYDQSGRKLAAAQTNADGYCAIPLDLEKLKTNVLVYAQKGGDTAIISTDKYNFDANIQAWEFGIYEMDIDYFLKNRNKRYFVVTDSPIYKPGADIKYKVYAREYNEKGLDYTKADIKVSILDPQWDVVYGKDLKPGADSSAVDDFKLKSDSKLGRYIIRINNNHVGEFLVSDYRAPRTKFRLRQDRGFTYPGLTETINISADYYSGQAIKNAPIDLTVSYQNLYLPGDYSGPYAEYSFYQDDYFSSIESKKQLNSGDLGRTKLVQPILNQTLKKPVRLGMEFMLQDSDGLNEQTSQYASYIVYPAEFKIGIRQKGFSNAVGEINEFNFVTLTNDDEMVVGQIEYAVYLDGVYTVRELGVGNSYEYLNSITPQKVLEGSLNTSEKSPAVLRQSFSRAGRYYILASGKDRAGRITTTKRYFYVNSGNYNWGRYNHDRIDIMTDKKIYDAGDTAQILIQSPYESAVGIVTIETNEIKEYKLIKINNNAPLIELEIKDDYYPNCFISIYLAQGRTGEPVQVDASGRQQIDLGKPSFKIGYQEIKVRKKDRDIEILAAADRTEYAPGEEVKVNVTFNNTSPQPTNYCVLVVNNALFDLASLKTDIGGNMNTLIPMLIENYTNYNRIVGRRLFGKKGAVAGGGGVFADLAESEVRQNFKDIVYFEPYLKSDAKQTGSFSFTLPDNTGEFRIIIFADNGPNLFGSGQVIVRSSQEISIENALPNFLRSTDKSKSGIVIFNNTNQTQSGDLNAQWDLNGTVLNSAEEKFTAQDTARINFDIQIPEFSQEKMQSLNVLVSAQTEQIKDTVKFSLPVYRNISKKVTAINKLILTDAEGNFSRKTVLRLSEPTENLFENLSSVKISFDRDVFDLLQDPSEYLIYYPHACWEQKLGMLIGNALVYKSNASLLQKMEAKKNIDAILSEDNKYRRANGFYGYWPSGSGYSHYLTVYTLTALNYLRGLDIPVDENMLKQLTETLKASLVSEAADSYQAPISKQYLIYELTQAGENMLDALEQKSGSLTLEDKLYRLAVLTKYNVLPQERETLKQEIISNIYIDQTDKAVLIQKLFMSWLHNTDVKSTALAMRILIDVPEMEQYALRFLNYLLEEKRHNNRWYNTHDNAQALMAIQTVGNKYFKGKLNAALLIDGEEVFADNVRNEIKSADLDVAKFSGEKDIETEVTAKGGANNAAFYKLEVTQYLKKREVSDDKSFKVRTEYFDLQGNKVTSFKRGENYIVRLNFNAYGDNTFVVCSDQLPAALMPIDFNQLNTQSSLAEKLKANVWPSYKEIRQDRVSYYFDALSSGAYYVEYAAQAIASGDYFDPGAYAEAMYAPDVRGTEKDARIICD